jgi:hypothetical protein
VHNRPYIEGKDLSRYSINRIRYLEWDSPRCPGQLSRATFCELYQGKKILRGRMTEGFLDTFDLLTNDSLYILRRFCDLDSVTNKSLQSSLTKNNSEFTRTQLETVSKAYSYEYLLCVINSTFANGYLNEIRRHKLRNVFYPDDFRNLPIILLHDQSVFNILSEYLQFLYVVDIPLAEEFNRFVNFLVYELYFEKLFFEKQLYLPKGKLLRSLLFSHLQPLNLDLWKDLMFKTLVHTANSTLQLQLREIQVKTLTLLQGIFQNILHDPIVVNVITKLAQQIAILLPDK